MTDKEKLDAIKAEIHRLVDVRGYDREMANDLFAFMDSLPNEPVSSIWHDASEPPIIDKTFLLIAPNGNSSLCLWGGKELHSVTIGGGHSVLCKGDIYSYINDLLNFDNSCNFGKNLQEEPVSEDLEEAAQQYSECTNPTCSCGECLISTFKAGAWWQFERVKEALLSEVLPCFMHGGEADEVVAKLDEVLNFQKK